MKKRIRFYNTIYFRVLLIFGIVFSVLLLLVGVVFMEIYSESVIRDYEEQLITESEEIAYNVEDYAINEEPSEFVNFMDAATSMLESQMVDAWILPNYKSDNRLKKRYTNVSVKYKQLSKGMKKTVKYVFENNESAVNQSYDEIYETDLIYAAAPVHDGGGRVIGVVLLNGIAESRINVINRCKSIIIMSLFIAWVVSFLIALFFARQISYPITKIRETANRLANGEYSIKTGINARGELGELEDTIDILSDKLAENERIRDRIERGRMDFFANVSHELRTPITVMRGYAESLADGYVTDKDKISYSLKRMLSECSTMERLVGDLLTLSKMQNPDFEVDKEPVSVVQIIENVIRSARVLCKEKNIEIKFNADDPYYFMLGDYDRLKQMFMIIVDNAIKFSDEGGKVEINIENADRMRISIRDYGVGIAEDMIPNIFDKFYRSKLRMNEKGSGLGLMIARQIAIKHGGSIEVESKLGEGSCFTFEFDGAESPEDEFYM